MTAVEKYKGFWISGTAKLYDIRISVWRVAGNVYRQGRGSSIIGVTRFEFSSCRLKDKDLAAFFGLEIARVVDDMTAQPRA